MTKELISEAAGYELLKTAGVPVPEYAIARTAEDAIAIATKIGFPVVLKVISPQIIHKSDAGGVRPGLNSPDEVKKAYQAIIT